MSLLTTFAAPASAATEKVLYSFCAQAECADGAQPYASVIDVDGTLYGTTSSGGTSTECYDGCGSVFSITPSGTEAVLYSFQDNGTDGNQPQASLINVNGTLYGTTAYGGANCDCGTVFKITLGGDEKVLHSFGSGSDGYNPFAGLINVKGTLYGMTEEGGAYGNGGTVFKVTLGGHETVLHSFQFGSETDGYEPYDSLITVNGTLYGTTLEGGTDSIGTVFSITTAGKETPIYSFSFFNSDGNGPYAGLVDVNGTLYGTTVQGGAYSLGTVFSVDPGTGAEKVLHSFGNGSDGNKPFAGLVNVNGTLYGTTYSGGTHSLGTIFSITPGGTEKVLHSFAGSKDGAEPYANLINVSGTLYGTTYSGGTSTRCSGGCGTVFSITP